MRPLKSHAETCLQDEQIWRGNDVLDRGPLKRFLEAPWMHLFGLAVQAFVLRLSKEQQHGALSKENQAPHFERND